MSSIYKRLTSDSDSKHAAGGSDDSKPVRKFANRQRVLLITSRGVTFRHRHLASDLASLMPHARREPKFDTKSQLQNLNEIAELYNCNNILYFEARKHADLYMWLAKAPNGPTMKFHVQNIHTMEELHFNGNCLKGSRPVLSFDASFNGEPFAQLMRAMFTQIFGVPPHARKSKPFVDHVMSFSIVDEKVWIRNYEISEQGDAATIAGHGELKLVEIGPRIVLTPITVLEGSFGGPVIYENKEYVSPNFARAQTRAKEAASARLRAEAAAQRQVRRRDQTLEADPLLTKNLLA